ncbi:hypothetical protein Hanom_Chr09g00789591 [Helianthus anomalus]
MIPHTLCKFEAILTVKSYVFFKKERCRSKKSDENELYMRDLLLLGSDTNCRIDFRPKRFVRKSSTPFQRRKQGNGRVHSLYHTLILLYIDFTTFTFTRNTGNTSVSDLNHVTNEMNV